MCVIFPSATFVMALYYKSKWKDNVLPGYITVCHKIYSIMSWRFCFPALEVFIYVPFYPLSNTTSPLQGHRVHRLLLFPHSTLVFVLKRPSSASRFTVSLFLCLLSVQLHRGLFLNKHNTSCILTNKSQALYFLWAAKSARGPFC